MTGPVTSPLCSAANVIALASPTGRGIAVPTPTRAGASQRATIAQALRRAVDPCRERDGLRPR